MIELLGQCFGMLVCLFIVSPLIFIWWLFKASKIDHDFDGKSDL